MKIGIVYYSRTGNTKYAAKILEGKLKEKKAEVDLIEIEHANKPGFFTAGRASMKQEELPIKNTNFDLKKYDFIITGSPTWAGNPTPFIKTFMSKAKNVKGKKAAIFSTGSSPINERQKSFGITKNNLESFGLKPIDTFLGLKVKKEKIIDGEANIDNFVNKIITD